MYFKIPDFGAKVECDTYEDIPQAMEYNDWDDMIENNGGTEPFIYEIDKNEYESDFDGFDVF